MDAHTGRVAALLLAAAVVAPAGSAHAGGLPPTPASYSRAVTRICAGALLFDGRHQIGTRAGAIAVSQDIRATGGTRLRRVDAVPKPPRTARVAARWIATEQDLVEIYASAYLRIWYEIDRARSPRERARLLGVLRTLIHAPDRLQRQAAKLEHILNVPDCTGGSPNQSDTSQPGSSGVAPGPPEGA